LTPPPQAAKTDDLQKRFDAAKEHIAEYVALFDADIEALDTITKTFKKGVRRQERIRAAYKQRMQSEEL
jgi:exonuclease VII small subunit